MKIALNQHPINVFSLLLIQEICGCSLALANYLLGECIKNNKFTYTYTFMFMYKIVLLNVMSFKVMGNMSMYLDIVYLK